jgi:hypothetical protein
MGEEIESKEYWLTLGDNKTKIKCEINNEIEPVCIPRRSFSGGINFKISNKAKRYLKVLFETTIENRKLVIIGQRTRKKRTKKKILGRINKNIYKQIQAGA